jgi:uncharacterized protein YciI
MFVQAKWVAGLVLALSIGAAVAQTPTPAQATKNEAPANYDAQLAASVGADDYGMRKYVLVILKKGPETMPKGPQRDAMFKGHFANIQRLADEHKLALAGPFDGVDGWEGLFVFAVPDVEEAKKLVATDPVIINHEMIAEYHKYYGSAALMLVVPDHAKVAKKSF